MSDSDKNKLLTQHLVEKYYDTDEKPSAQVVLLLALQQIIVYLPLIILPTLHLLNASKVSDVYNAIALILLGSALSSCLCFAKSWMGGGVFLPITMAIPLYALCLFYADSSQYHVILNFGLSAGLIQLLMTPLIKWGHRIFNLHLASFITILLGIWVSEMGLVALFFPKDATPLLFTEDNQYLIRIHWHHLALGFFSLALMLYLRLSEKKKSRLFCLLYGSVIPWGIAFLAKMIEPHALAQSIKAPWFALPHVNFGHLAHLQLHFSLPVVIAGIVLSLHVFSMLTMINYANGRCHTLNLVNRLNTRGNIASSLGLILSSVFFFAPLSANPAAFGSQKCVGVYSRTIALGYASILVMLAFSPKVALFFTTIPAAVRGATILFIGSTMFMKGLEYLDINKMSPLHAFIFVLSLLLGASFAIVPSFYLETTEWLSKVTNPMFVLSIMVFFFFHLLFYKQKHIW